MSELNVKRRTLLKGAMAAGTVSVAVGAGLLAPSVVLAAWPEKAFRSKSVDAAIKAMDVGSPEPSGDIKIKAPDIAENGAVVPVTVSTNLKAEAIAIMAAANSSPLAADFILEPGTEAYVSTRIKMGKTADVVALVKSGGKLYSARKSVKVTIGGCGG